MMSSSTAIGFNVSTVNLFHHSNVLVAENHLPFKKRCIRMENFDSSPYKNEYPAAASPSSSDSASTTSTLSSSSSSLETCSIDSGFCDIEPLDLSLHSTLISSSINTNSNIKRSGKHQHHIDHHHQFNQNQLTSFPSGTNRLICPSCNKVYESNARFRAHIRRHESKESGRYKCNVCFKNFVQRSSLRTHERIHTGEKPYHCNVCDERFGDFSTFTKHRRTHTGEKPYSCPVCMRSFSQSGNMHRHLKVVHKPRPDLYREWTNNGMIV